jgi:probable HAF family extracellular repeat protein
MKTENVSAKPLKLAAIALLWGLIGATPVPGQSTIVEIPGLGGSVHQVTGLNSNGMAAGFSRTPADADQHALLFSGGHLYDLGGIFSLAAGLSSAGLVAGDSLTPDMSENHAFLFRPGGNTDLGTLGGSFSTAAGINDAGQVVGGSYLAGDSGPVAFLYTGGTMSSLGTLGGSASSAASINSAGQIAGYSYTSNDVAMHAVLFSAGSVIDLGTLGGPSSSALAVNSAGQVTGDSDTADFQNHAFLFSGGVMSDVGTLGGSFSTPNGLNDLGQVVGDSSTSNNVATHAFVYSGGQMFDLGTLNGGDSSAAGINNSGQVVGQSTDSTGTRAFLSRNGVMTDLNTLLPANSGWVLLTADFINDAGQIAGSGVFNGNYTSYLFTPAGNHPPVANAGAAQTVECPASAMLDGSGSSDPDGDVLTYEWRENGAILATGMKPSVALSMGAHVITLAVTDPHGASAQASVTVTVVDTTPPVVVCPNAVTVAASAKCDAPVPDFISGTRASDACSSSQLTATQSPVPGTLVGPGAHVVTVTVSDAAGNGSSCTVTFTVADTTPPVVSPLADSTASADANCQAAVPDFTVGLGAADNCTAPAALVKSQSPAAGTPVGIGAHTVTVTVSDASGNATSVTGTFTVRDTTPPVVVCPNSVTVSASANCDAAVPDFVSATRASDRCSSGQLTATQTPAAGTLVGCGAHVVTITVSDAAGNVSNCTVTFTVVDRTPPVVSPLANSTALANGNCQAAVPDFTAGLVCSDNCTALAGLVKSQSPAAGTLMGLGAHVVTVTVSDASGNATSVTGTFTVRDTTPPVIASVAASPNTLKADGSFVHVTVAVAASDNCDAAPVSRIISVTSDEPVTGPGDKTSPDWVITGDLTVDLRAERASRGDGRTYTITVQSADASGNVCTANCTVFVPKK